MNIDTDTQYAFTRPIVTHICENIEGVLKIDGEVGNKKVYDPRSPTSRRPSRSWPTASRSPAATCSRSARRSAAPSDCRYHADPFNRPHSNKWGRFSFRTRNITTTKQTVVHYRLFCRMPLTIRDLAEVLCAKNAATPLPVTVYPPELYAKEGRSSVKADIGVPVSPETPR